MALRRVNGDADPRPEPARIEPPEPEPAVAIASLSELAELAGSHRDLKLKAMIRRYLRPVRIDPGRLEIALHDDAPRAFIGELDGRLKEWTGRRWIISISREPGGQTLEEIDSERHDKRVRDAGEDPDVAAILAQFPGARIRDVRIRVDEQDELPSELQSEEGDILPEAFDED